MGFRVRGDADDGYTDFTVGLDNMVIRGIFKVLNAFLKTEVYSERSNT